MKRNDIVGVDQLVPVLGGRMVCYVNLDNAATTPPLRAVVDAVEQFLPFAASVHRGTGYKSRLSTAAFEDAREAVGHFVGADPERDVVVFTKNTTEAINQLARTLALADDAVVLTTMLEHHSNLLPWRHRATTVCIRARLDGSLDEDDLDAQLARYGNRVALLAVTGASNVTGVVPPIHRLAGKVHAVGGAILVDAAQLAGHRPIDMLAHDDPGHLDVIALSAHKLYAPYGSGALVGDRQLLDVDPEPRGGGTVRAVTRTDVVWADLPDRAEAGSPNLLGAIAFAAATRRLQRGRTEHDRRPRTAVGDVCENTSRRATRREGVRRLTCRVGCDLVHGGPIGPTAGGRRARLRARHRCAQWMLLRPAVCPSSARPRRRRRRAMGR